MNRKIIQESPRSGECCCGPAANVHIAYRPVQTKGRLTTPAGDIAKVSTEWSMGDYFGAIAVRVGIHRMNYAVCPGLYAVGDPGKDDPVLVSANYKLSFDVLRRELAGLNAWILVIDTKGVNVWCAAGKGTFGTMEIAKRVMATRLADIVTARKLIVPQLGAPGVAADMVQAFCDFTVLYGPVRARDIRRYLKAGMKADAAMRRVTFGMLERISVAWLELAQALKIGIGVAAGLFVLMGIGVQGFSPAIAWARSSMIIGLIAVAIVSGTVLTAILLPFLPGKAFSFKGGLLGAVTATGMGLLRVQFGHHALLSLSLLSSVLFTSAVSAYLALNFTGCSTYTSVSGVKKEIRLALPVIIGLLLLSVLFQVVGRI